MTDTLLTDAPLDPAQPLLDPTPLPRFGEVTPAAIGPALAAAIARRDAVVAALTETRPTSFAEVWMPYERANRVIDDVWSTVSHLHGVADTPELRAAHAAGQEMLVEAGVRIGQNRDLYDLFAGLAATPAFAALPLADRAVVERALRDFRLSGVALEAAARDRFGAVSVELSGLANDFGSAVLDATEAWHEDVTDPELLAGISPTDRAMFAAAATAAGQTGWRITLQQPSIAAVMTFADNRDLRARVYRAAGTRASDEGPHAGQFDNGDRIARILSLRREAAVLLGYHDAVDRSLATKMAPDAPAVLDFLRDLARRARPAAERDIADLTAFAASDLNIDDLQPWDIAYASNRLRTVRYAIDEQVVRAYFPVGRVLAGWESLLDRLFGIRLIRRDDVALWHGDAAYYDIADADGTIVAGLYTDLHARVGKRGGAWMASARSRVRDGATVQMPVAYLTCNFAPNDGETPALLSHSDITTLLHETGHCLHHLFGEVDRPDVGGITGFEWDAVELPSQLMEDFAWDPAVLTGMSGHYQTGEPLPRDLFDRLLAARRFQSGMALLRQIEFALFDLLLHRSAADIDPMTVLEQVRDEVSVVRPPRWHRFPHAFSHIFAGGYAAGYYSYLWAELLAADGFRAFAEAGVVDRATGDRFRAEVLARGATRPAVESYRAFRGRDADPAAMLDRHGLGEPIAA